jgi:hypothetical protein
LARPFYGKQTVDPKEFDTPEGRLRFQILREMFRALASHSGWIHTVSNWALGTTGVYVGLIVSNLDKLEPHLSKGWQGPVFWCAAISAAVGIGIQIVSGLVQFSLPIENHLMSLLLPLIEQPEKFGISANRVNIEVPRILNRVTEEFISSRPWAWGEFAKYTMERGQRDLVYATKNAASLTQMMFVFLVLQYILLGAAIFWPLALVR